LVRTTLNAFKPRSLSLPLNFSRLSNFSSNARASLPTSCASWPVTATIRRIPLAIPDSSVITKSLMSPVFATWLIGKIGHPCNITKRRQTYVPPQNSTLVFRHWGFSISRAISFTSYSSVTTRTGSGYDSPKTARSPGMREAVSRVNSLLKTLTLRLIQSKLSDSIC